MFWKAIRVVSSSGGSSIMSPQGSLLVGVGGVADMGCSVEILGDINWSASYPLGVGASVGCGLFWLCGARRLAAIWELWLVGVK